MPEILHRPFITDPAESARLSPLILVIALSQRLTASLTFSLGSDARHGEFILEIAPCDTTSVRFLPNRTRVFHPDASSPTTVTHSVVTSLPRGIRATLPATGRLRTII